MKNAGIWFLPEDSRTDRDGAADWRAWRARVKAGLAITHEDSVPSGRLERASKSENGWTSMFAQIVNAQGVKTDASTQS